MQITIDQEGSGELYLKIMKAICGETEGNTMLDIGAHKAPYTPQLGFSHRTYVDIQDREMDFKEEKKYFHKVDAVRFLKRGNYFDTIIASDFLEHLKPQKGRVLIYLMEKYSRKQIIFTPLGDHEVNQDGHPDSHHSGWNPDYFSGWASIVMPGFHKSLGIGAFFTWHCDNIQEDFKRVKQELSWIK